MTMFMGVPIRKLSVHAALDAKLMPRRRNLWGEIKGSSHTEIGCFLEGPDFDALGNLYVTDIPFGRIFRVTPDGIWDVVAEYDGWPNGLKVARDGTLLVADHKLGLVRVDPARGVCEVVVDNAAGEPLLGLNDLTLAPDGLYATDQGNTGLNDPHGRVLHIDREFRSRIVLDCGPSPNGLVLDAVTNTLLVAMTRANAIWRLPIRQGLAQRVGISIQLSGGIGPDGLAFDRDGNLLVAHPPLGLWRFDREGAPREIYRDPGSVITNLAIRTIGEREHVFVTDSLRGRILTAALAPLTADDDPA